MNVRQRPVPRRSIRSARLVTVLSLGLTLAAGLSACGSSGGGSSVSSGTTVAPVSTPSPSTGPSSSTGGASSDGSAGPAGTAKSDAPSAASGSDAPGQTSGAGGASASLVEVCDLLPVVDVARLSGLPLTTAEKVDLPGPTPVAKCSYTSEDRSQQIGVTTRQVGNLDALKQVLATEAGINGGKEVAGVGDLAYFSSAPGVGGLTVVYGTTEVKVSATQEIQQDVAIQIADALHAKL